MLYPCDAVILTLTMKRSEWEAEESSYFVSRVPDTALPRYSSLTELLNQVLRHGEPSRMRVDGE
jgi:hypothetical protein